MLIGAMNHPASDIEREIEWMSAFGMEFLDLTLEPPLTASWIVNPRAIRDALERHKMIVVGHTAFYLPVASAIEEVRRAAVTELRRCLEMFSEIGARWMNIHPDRFTPMHDRQFMVRRNLESINELLPDSRRLGVGLMIENLPGEFNDRQQLGELLGPLPDLALHLDFGHSNLLVPHNTAEEILSAYGERLAHVHLHDNKGGSADLHLPLGTGTVDLHMVVRSLKRCGYDGTITLEVFTPDRRHLEYSRDLLRKVWEETEVRSKESVGVSPR